MNCPSCGNELEPGEAFCGQCGTSTGHLGQATEMVQAPYNGQVNNPYITNVANPNANPNANKPSPLPTPYNTSVMPPDHPFTSAASISPNQTPVRPSTPQQQPAFYQDATESISALPPNVSPYPPGPRANQYAPQGQNFQGGNYTQHSYPPISSGPGYYGGPPASTPHPTRQKTSPFLVIICVLLALAIVAVIALGAVYVLNRHSSSPRTQITPIIAPTATSAPTPTVVPSPSPSPTASPSPTVTVTPTATPFANFSWCDTTCTSNGFAVQFPTLPTAWNQSQLTNVTGVEFLNPAQQDEYAIFKTPGATNSTAGDLITSDLQTSYSSLPGYMKPTTTSVNTIGGETWTSAVASYQSQAPGPKERVEVFATVHGGKGYIIELQAPDNMFNSASSQYFNTMIASFQFL